MNVWFTASNETEGLPALHPATQVVGIICFTVIVLGTMWLALRDD